MTNREEAEEDDGVKIHEIKFDEYGIMDDGVDESTDSQLAKLNAAKAGKGCGHYFGSVVPSHFLDSFSVHV